MQEYGKGILLCTIIIIASTKTTFFCFGTSAIALEVRIRQVSKRRCPKPYIT